MSTSKYDPSIRTYADPREAFDSIDEAGFFADDELALAYLAGFYADEEGGMDDEYCPDCFFNE
jgi:hypothetical protein